MNLNNIELNNLQALVAVVSLGSMSKAAELLHTTRQSVARSISALESQLGHKLFDRNYNGMQPTEFCKQLYPYACAVMDSVDSMLEFAKAYSVNDNTITFGILGLYGAGLLVSSLLKEFQVQNPAITVNLKYKPWPDINNAVLSGELDYAYSSIIPGHMPEELKCVPVVEEEFTALIHKDDKLARSEVITPQQLQERDLVLYTRYGIQALFIDNYQKQQSVQFRPYVTTYEREILIKAIEQGDLIGLVDRDVAESVTAASDTITSKQISPAPTRCTGFIYRKSMSEPAIHKKLLSFLKRRIIANRKN